MKLKDYVNFRNRGKGNKQTEYNIRTQHFYDGKRGVTVDGISYTGIRASFMNQLAIPNDNMIALRQKREFVKIFQRLSPQQKYLLDMLNLSTNKQSLYQTNIELKAATLRMISEFEKAIDELLTSEKKLSNLYNQGPQPSNLPEEQQLRASFNKLNVVFSKLQQQHQGIINRKDIDPYLKELENNIESLAHQVNSDSNLMFFNDKIFDTKTTGEKANFIWRLGYLSKQIRGISLLEHEGIEFFKKIPLPDDIVVVNTGQILVGGAQASQDALVLDKNLKIKLKNGKEITMEELAESKNFNTTIQINEDEFDKILQQAIGIQSKYHRYGYIKMGNIKMEDIIKLNMKQAQALRNLYRLYLGTTPYMGENVSHSFNIKKSHSDYKALFSYCLSRFLNRLINRNYYMLTKQGIIDSYTYYMNLFQSAHYFAPIGKVSLYPIDQEYRIAIQENI